MLNRLYRRVLEGAIQLNAALLNRPLAKVVLKIFRILAERYRNRRRRFGLRFNLIAGIYNYELNSSG